MKKLSSIILGATSLSLLLTDNAHAAINTQALYSISGIANLALILLVLIGLTWSMKIMSLVRGGMLSKSWQMFTIGFVFLLIARLLIVTCDLSLFAAPDYIVNIFYGLMVLAWLIGVYQTKRTLA